MGWVNCDENWDGIVEAMAAAAHSARRGRFQTVAAPRLLR